jgi:hypothetical protein
MSDEIIMALRAVKEKLAEEAGFDIQRMVEIIRLEEKLSTQQGRIVLPPPTGDSIEPRFQQIRFAKH